MDPFQQQQQAFTHCTYLARRCSVARCTASYWRAKPWHELATDRSVASPAARSRCLRSRDRASATADDRNRSTSPCEDQQGPTAPHTRQHQRSLDHGTTAAHS